MSFTERLMSKFGYIKDSTTSTCGCDVEIQDGKIIGNSYTRFGTGDGVLTEADLDTAYERVSCIGSSVDLIADNIQMIEPVFWDNDKREALETPTNKALKRIRKLFEKPNATDNRKTFLAKTVKNYVLHGAVYFGIIFAGNEPIVIKVIDNALISYVEDVTNARIKSYRITNCGVFSGNYSFNGSYYECDENKNMIIAPYIHASSYCQYLPISILAGSALETLMYWYGCFHNKSLLENGARPSLIVLIKSMLNPNHLERLKQDIRIKHSGAGNAGGAIILDGAADKDVKQVSQTNKDMEYNAVIQQAESAIYRRLGVHWILDKNISASNYDKGMEMFFDMCVCPFFQSFYNHLFDVFKKYNDDFSKYSIFYLEQDVPALQSRFLARMKELPTLGIFTVKERRKAYNYPPLGDERDNELAVQSVSVMQSGMSPDKTNTTSFSGGGNNGKNAQNQDE